MPASEPPPDLDDDPMYVPVVPWFAMRRIALASLVLMNCKVEEHPQWQGTATATGTSAQTSGDATDSTPGTSSTTAVTGSAGATSSSGGTGVSASSTTSSSSGTTAEPTGSTSTGGSTTGPIDGLLLFVSSSTQMADFGGFAGGDTICQNLADTAGLTGTFLSVLGEAQVTVADRITIDKPVVNAIGELVASDATSLWNGNLSASVGYDENGDPAAGMPFTGADVGGIGSANNCGTWTATNANAAVGDAAMLGPGWLRFGTNPCDTPSPIYCIEQ